ncbi:MAG: PEGA domain-containing protein [Candidatus Saccharimonadales bacterium]
MEFLDPKKQKQHHIYLMINYGLMTIGLILATAILVSLVYGFGFDRKGQVTRSGLVFVSSTPSGAEVWIDGKKQDSTTNTRFLLQEGRYTIRLSKQGYTDWQRSVIVNGSILERFDYPMLIPQTLSTATAKSYGAVVQFASQSRDRRWLLAQDPGIVNGFITSDLNNRVQNSETFALPATILTDAAATQSWKEVEWSTDNRHLLVQRTYMAVATSQPAAEFILIDREKPAESVNVSTVLSAGQSDIRLVDGARDVFYMLDPSNQRLLKASLENVTPQTVLNGVVAFKSYGDDKVLYVTSVTESEEKAAVRLKDGDKNYQIRSHIPAHGTYLLELARHDGNWYVAAGEQSENRVPVYKNPVDSLRQLPNDPLVPIQVLKVQKPAYVAFSANTRFIMATGGQNFYTYDIKNDKGYQYTATQPLDSPQTSARWMDGYRLVYISGGKLIMFDYDYTNQRTLQQSSPAFLPFFDRDYEFVYSMLNQSDTTGPVNTLLQSTALRLENDL